MPECRADRLHRVTTSPPNRALGGRRVRGPGGRTLDVLKRGAELLMWTRVALQRRFEHWVHSERALPTAVPVTAVLGNAAAWRLAVRQARDLRLPLHRDLPKNWDALGAVQAVLSSQPPERRHELRILDAGSARYSPVLPWFRLYGVTPGHGWLLGMNLEFGQDVLRDGVIFRYGDITRTGLPSASLDAVTCLSVIEHGVPVGDFLIEVGRILRRGGVLCISTDYDQQPPDTTGLAAYGAPVHIFGPDEIRSLVCEAAQADLQLVGNLDSPGFFEHSERSVHWKRTALDYTFILLTFRRV